MGTQITMLVLSLTRFGRKVADGIVKQSCCPMSSSTEQVQRVPIRLIEDPRIKRKPEVVLDFRERSERHVEEPSELARTFLGAAFDNVRGR